MRVEANELRHDGRELEPFGGGASSLGELATVEDGILDESSDE